MKQPGRSYGAKQAVAIAVVALCAAACIGAAALAAVQAALSPKTLQGGQSAEFVAVNNTEFDDKRSVQISMGFGQPDVASVQATGLVSETRCAVGASIRSGSSPISVSGQPKIALATANPLWRDITNDNSGRDVDNAHEALRALNFDVPKVGEPADKRTFAAWSELRKQAGHSKPQVASIALGDVVWVPKGEPPVSQCHVGAGSTVSPETPIVTYQPRVTEARIVSLPNNLAPGPRKLTIAGAEVPVSDTGKIADLEPLREISLQQPKTGENNEPATTPAEYALVEKVTVAIVPPSAVVGTERTCVITPEGSTPVTVLNSRMGQTYVSSKSDTTLTTVAPSPEAGASCS